MALSLPLKYRPKIFEDLVGQDTLARYLSALITRGPIPRNIIISGQYGSGKSSSCRIYARALNCLAPTPSGSPCNTCQHCQLFFQDRFPDYLEIDAASRGKVDQIKELLEIARTPPLYGRFRVINLDECLHYDTLVELADGSREKIGSLVSRRFSGEVRSFNETTHRIENKLVTNWIAQPTTLWTEIFISGHATPIRCSSRHLHYTTQGLKYTHHLQEGDFLFHLDASQALISSPISCITRDIPLPHPHSQYRYCLEVADNHNFFINNGILTHNCQAISRHGYDALLKIIEEPPPYLVFIFTTTELNKVREAVQSRCQKLTVKLLPHDLATQHLTQICHAESISHEPQALSLIAHLSLGHPRDLLTNLEQATLLGPVTLDSVLELFSLTYTQHLTSFMLAIFQDRLFDAITHLRDWGEDPPIMIDRIREYALYLHYTFIHAQSATLNPAFATIPTQHHNAVISAFRATATAASLSPESASHHFISTLTRAAPTTPIALELFAHDLHTFIHHHRYASGSFSLPNTAPPNPRPTRARQGRQFSHQFHAPAPDPTPSSAPDPTPSSAHEPTPSSAHEPEPIYPHHLLRYGFVPHSTPSLNITLLRG